MKTSTWCLVAVWTAAACSGADDDCGVCVEDKCADLVSYCSEDPDCACMAECLAENAVPGIDACLGTCGVDTKPPRFLPVESCVAVACPDSEDECSTPAGWTAPEPPELEGVVDGDVGGGDEAHCAFDDALAFDPEGSVLQLQSMDGEVCVRVERLDSGPGSLANTEWTLLDIRVGSRGKVAHVDDPARMCWYSSHHNFADFAHVKTDARLHGLKLHEDGHGGPRSYTLYTFESGPLDVGDCPALSEGDRPVGQPLQLFPSGR